MNHPKFTALSALAPVTVAAIVVMAGCNTSAWQWPQSTPELKILYNTEEEQAEKSSVAQLVQAQLTKAAIPITLEPVPSAVFYKRLGNGDFQCALALLSLDYVDPAGFLTDFYSKSGFRLSKYESADYDQAYLSGLWAPTGERRRDGFIAAHRILMKDLPWVPLYSNSDQFLLAPGTEEFRSNAYQYYDYRRIKRESIRAASNAELQSLDPALVYDVASRHLATQSYEGLVTMDEKLQKIVPALAESWQFSPSMDRLSFNLRQGVKFHGNFGTLDAEDVRASFERMLLQSSPYAYVFDHVKGVGEFKSKKAAHVSGFVVENATRFSIELQEPFPTMLNWLLAPAAFVLPAELPTPYDFRMGSVGTGPFMLTSWDGTLAVLKANPSYWGKDEDGADLPRAKSLSIRFIKQVNNALTAFERGELDLLNVPPPLYGEVFDQMGQVQEAYSKYKLRVVPLNNLRFLAFRMGVDPWGTDATLRQKVYDGIDRNSIVTALFRSKARAARGIIPQMEGMLQ